MDEITIDGLRAQAYTGLALAFDRPDDELFEVLETGDLAEVLTATGEALESDELIAAAAELATIDPDQDAISRAYARSFGLESQSGVPLYEVAYAPGSLMTSTDILADIAGFYRAFGLATAEGSRDRVDALATQLEFVGFLAFRRAQYLDDDELEGIEIVTDATTVFLEDHLGRWVPRLVLEVLDGIEEPTYRTLADALGVLIETDLERFGAEPDVYTEVPTPPLSAVAGFDADSGRMDIGCGATAPHTQPIPEVDQ